MRQVLREREQYKAMVEDLAPQVRAFEPLDMDELSLFVAEVERRLALLSDERMVLRGFPSWPDARLEVLREANHRHWEVVRLKEALDPSAEAWAPKSDVREELLQVIAKFETVKPTVEWYLRAEDALCKNFRQNKVPFDFRHVHAVKEGAVELASYSMSLVLEALPPSVLDSASPPIAAQAEQLLRNCLAFAFKCHQFAGGFDPHANTLFSNVHDALVSLIGDDA